MMYRSLMLFQGGRAMATAEEINAAIGAKGDEIRALKTAKAEKDEVMAKVAELNVSHPTGFGELP